jgi:antitoxin ParD1/3/4
MNIALKPDHLKWLQEQVAAGNFSSVDDALALAVSEFMEIEDDDLTWAQPLVDEARASIARGEGISAADVKAETEVFLLSLGS